MPLALLPKTKLTRKNNYGKRNYNCRAGAYSGRRSGLYNQSQKKRAEMHRLSREQNVFRLLLGRLRLLRPLRRRKKEIKTKMGCFKTKVFGTAHLLISIAIYEKVRTKACGFRNDWKLFIFERKSYKK